MSDAAPLDFSTKAAFYQWRLICNQIRAQHGLGAAMRWAYDLHLRAASAGVRPMLPDESWDTISKVQAALPRASFWRRAFAGLATHNFLAAMTATTAAILSGDPLHPELDRIVPDGPDHPFPVWHLLNPFYHIWRAAVADGSDGQAHWRGNPSVIGKHPPPTEDGYSEWCRLPNRERDGLVKFLTDHRVSSILDIGCSDGLLLRFLIDRMENTTAFCGVELHQNRIDAAMALIQRTPRKHWCAELERHDLLSDEPLPDAELVTAMQVFGAFSDAQLLHVLAKIKACGARHIFDASVFNSYSGWKGRTDPAPLFAQAGWRLVGRQLLGDPIYPEHALTAVLVPKYWSARAANVWERMT